MNRPHIYEIHVAGLLSGNWSEWLEGLTIESRSEDQTIITGMLTDQAALLGILAKLHTLNLTITMVSKVT